MPASQVIQPAQPPSKDFGSCHLAQTPPVHFVGPLYHLLGWVPCLLPPGVSSACWTTPHMSKQSLRQPLAFDTLCLVVPWILSLIFQMDSPLPSCIWRSCSLLFSLPLWVVVCCRVSPSMASRQRRRHPARNSTQTQVRSAPWSRQAGMYCILSGRWNRSKFFARFFLDFCPWLPTFATDYRVLELVVGWAILVIYWCKLIYTTCIYI